MVWAQIRLQKRKGTLKGGEEKKGEMNAYEMRAEWGLLGEGYKKIGGDGQPE